ncbi:response regulator transcription factor [Arvimicrobium flavum]|uniref:response regulator n=1 Tax=Arvimicrobium flavum TaxID=3393320 RepID=UPI00237B4594|nr:response regulator transcription factor [Mesorhizobium shangrilense]
MRVLIVEDDPILRDGLSVGLKLAGFIPDAVATCGDADAALRASEYDAVVLDVMLPDGSGLDLLAERRRLKDPTPILLLTARDQIADRIAGLDAGADDYLGKPFDLDELAARVRAILRRGSGRASSVLQWADVTLDPATLTVRRDGRTVPLTRREFTLLRALMERPGTVLGKSALEEALYGWQEGVESNAVEVHIHHLRSKIGPGVVETVRGVGYRVGTEI